MSTTVLTGISRFPVDLAKLERTVRAHAGYRDQDLQHLCMEQELADLISANPPVEEVQLMNFEMLLRHAKELGIKYLYLTERDMFLTDDADYQGWPAVWHLTDRMCMKSACGNSNQRQHGEAANTVLFGSEVCRRVICVATGEMSDDIALLDDGNKYWISRQ